MKRVTYVMNRTAAARRVALTAACAAMILAVADAAPARVNWMERGGHWTSGSLWTQGVPTADKTARVSSGRNISPPSTAYIYDGDTCYAGTLEVSMGVDSRGAINQNGGSLAVTGTGYIGSTYGRGWYTLSGGQLSASSVVVRNYGDRSNVLFDHSSGQATCGSLSLIVHGHYDLHGDGRVTVNGPMSQEDDCLFEVRDTGSLTVTGAAALGGRFQWEGAATELSLGSLAAADTFRMQCTVGADGLSALAVADSAALAGRWDLVDTGAPLGRFDVLAAPGGITGEFASVHLPEDWTWGIDGGTTLYAEHVPEPATAALVVLGALGLMSRRRREGFR